jgi:hypothetical protein
MAKRAMCHAVAAAVRGQALLVAGAQGAPVLELMCSHFVLTLAAKQGPQVQCAARHQWPAVAGRPPPRVARARAAAAARISRTPLCRTTTRGGRHESLDGRTLLERHGVWRGPYEEGTLFFYLDEYAKDQPKDLLSVLTVTATG